VIRVCLAAGIVALPVGDLLHARASISDCGFTQRRPGRWSSADSEGLDRQDADWARAIAMGQRSRIRLRLLDSWLRRPQELLRVGLRRAVHLYRSRSRSRDRHHVPFGRVPGAAGPPRRRLCAGPRHRIDVL